VAGLLVGFVGSRVLRRSGGLGGAGRSAPELQRACFDAAVRHVQRDGAGHQVLPASFRLSMHPDDVATVDDARGWFIDGLASALADAAATNGWLVASPIEIDLVPDAQRRRGAPIALALQAPQRARTPTKRAATRSPSAGSGRAEAGLTLVRVDTGVRLAVVGEHATVGRASTCDLTIDDKRVSRHHATLRRGSTGWTVTDEASANGTSVNGRRIDPRTPTAVAPGDTVGLGPIGLVLRLPSKGGR
jgi:pSer/pThr/pTyr-binding forkhead associated (FHA) protein